MQERPISDYVYAIKIEKRQVGLTEVYDYSVRNETYWLLNNYFVLHKNMKELIDFCREHEEIFEKDWSLFFMYQGALKVLGLDDERRFQLKKHTAIFDLLHLLILVNYYQVLDFLFSYLLLRYS